MHWRRTRPPRWRYRASLNGLGAAATGVATVVFLLTKFRSRRSRPVGQACYSHRSFVARTAAWTRFRTSSLRRISWMCVFTVFSLR